MELCFNLLSIITVLLLAFVSFKAKEGLTLLLVSLCACLVTGLIVLHAQISVSGKPGKLSALQSGEVYDIVAIYGEYAVTKSNGVLRLVGPIENGTITAGRYVKTRGGLERLK